MKFYFLLLMAPLIAWAAEDPYAAQLFQKNCASCHASSAQAGARIPQMDVLKSLSPVEDDVSGVTAGGLPNESWCERHARRRKLRPTEACSASSGTPMNPN